MFRLSVALRTLLPVILIPFIPSVVLGQAIPQFSTVETHQYDSINLATLGIQMNVPVRAKAGHIPFSLSLTGSSQVTVVNPGSPPPNGGFLSIPTLSAQESYLGRAVGFKSSQCPGQGGVLYQGFSFTDSAGNTHPFPNIALSAGAVPCASSSMGAYANDSSGLFMSASVGTTGPLLWTVTDPNGNFTSGSGNSGITKFADPNGNSITPSGGGVYTDTLNQTAVTGASGQTISQTLTWADALGNNRSVSLTTTPSTIQTAFGCSEDSAPLTGLNLPTSVTFPDGSAMSFTWEKTFSNSADFTGRLASITLPTGGTISYAYSGGTNGINCSDGTPATMTRTTPDGVWTYTHTPGTNPATTVTDPQGNNLVYTFSGGVFNMEIEKQVYNGTVDPAHLIQTVITCYNNPNSTPANCNSNFSSQITEKDVYTTYPGVTGYSAVKTAYTATAPFGLVTDLQTFDFNATTPTTEKQIVYGSGNPTSQTCTAIGSHITGKPCSITVLDSQNSNAILSQTWNSYDSNGNLLQTWDLVSGSGASGTYLSKQYTYDSHGVVQTMTDVNGQVTNYTTTSCNNMFVTSQSPQNFSNLTTSKTFDCNGGVVTSATDANSQITQTKFSVNTQADPFFRPLQKIDELSNVTSFAYTPNSTESIFTFNSGLSVIDQLSTEDSIGRPVISQVVQSPGGTNWDTKSRSFDSDGRVFQTSLACVSTKGTGCTASTESQTYDALNRPLVHTGTGGDVTTKSYIANDVLTTVTPAPANENSKGVQKEYDGLRRLKSVCVISSANGSGPCGQANSKTGFLTTYAYDAGGRLLQVIENAQVSSPQQTRSYTYDLLGRILSEANPESGTKTYVYDSVNGTNCASSSSGDLVQELDANGNTTCHHYDSLHRETCTTYAGPNSNGISKYFVYDAASVNGIAMSNAEGRMAEAYTCAGSNPPPCSPKITDEGFSYDQRGQMSAYYQNSPNSGGYYALTAGPRWEDGQLKTVSGVGLPTLTFGTLDGEGRVTTVNASTGLNPVVGVTYNAANNTQPVGALLTTSLGSDDAQNYTYDKNTLRITQYSASVGATPVTISGNLTWNANGTLAENNIVDGYNSANTQDCKYLYDDRMWVAAGLDNTPGVNCTNGSTNAWNQTFSYDAFGNLTKSTSGPGTSWMPGYNTANNHYILAGTSYDNNGNLINDTFHTYTWLADGHVATVDLTDGAPGTGSVAISSPTGGEQSKGNPAKSGMGSVTINGTEGLFLPCPRCSPTWDSGTVKITANGHTDQISYAHGDTATTVANNLAGQIRNNSPYIDYTSVITNSPTSVTINLVARTAGASTNYALSATSKTNDPTHFNVPSFTTSTSGATLTGGTDSSLVYDSGTCTVTVNGTPYAKNFGQGDTASTIASGLAGVISAGSVVSATASGATLSLTAKAGGPSTNYSLSSSCSFDSSNFSGPSFTAAASGSALTGGTNGPNVGSITYDAMGNKVEENVNGTIHEYVSAFGVSAQMTGQTQNSTLVDLPGGVQALYSGGALQRFRFPDWQGTIRAESDPINRVFTESLAFAPFGERYAVKGTPYNVDSFTGKLDQIVSDEYDFPARQQHSGQGRWISPDPMRGTGNKYVYADNNPLSKVDLYGLYGYQYNPGNNPSTGDETEGAVGIEWPESHEPQSVQTGSGTTEGGVGIESWNQQFQTGSDAQANGPPPVDCAGPLIYCFEGSSSLDLLFGSGGGGAGGDGGRKPSGPANPKGSVIGPNAEAQAEAQDCVNAIAEFDAASAEGEKFASEMNKDYWLTLGVGAAVGCAVGALGTETATTGVGGALGGAPGAAAGAAGGTPLAVGNCAVGAIGGAVTENAIFGIVNMANGKIQHGVKLDLALVRASLEVRRACRQFVRK